MTVHVRRIEPRDYDRWLTLWHGYNAFYGRSGATSLPQEITAETWRRFFDPLEPVFAIVAEYEGALAGIAHYLFHRSTTAVGPVCYMQDLFTAEPARGAGIGRALIEKVYELAAEAGADRVYWQTQDKNVVARGLYDNVAEHAGFIVYRKFLR